MRLRPLISPTTTISPKAWRILVCKPGTKGMPSCAGPSAASMRRRTALANWRVEGSQRAATATRAGAGPVFACTAGAGSVGGASSGAASNATGAGGVCASVSAASLPTVGKGSVSTSIQFKATKSEKSTATAKWQRRQGCTPIAIPAAPPRTLPAGHRPPAAAQPQSPLPMRLSAMPYCVRFASRGRESAAPTLLAAAD